MRCFFLQHFRENYLKENSPILVSVQFLNLFFNEVFLIYSLYVENYCIGYYLVFVIFLNTCIAYLHHISTSVQKTIRKAHIDSI